jgi:hypothetical protein
VARDPDSHADAVQAEFVPRAGRKAGGPWCNGQFSP